MLSKNWLDKNNIDYDKLIVNAIKKDVVCKNEKVDLFIDDQLNNCIDISKCGIKAIRITKDTTSYNNITYLYNWNDIYSYIERLNTYEEKA